MGTARNRWLWKPARQRNRWQFCSQYLGGYGGVDTLRGNGGNDVLISDGGGSTFVFGRGDGIGF